MQARCKVLGLRATGSNEEMRLRLAEAEKDTPSNPGAEAVLQGVEPMMAAAAAAESVPPKRVAGDVSTEGMEAEEAAKAESEPQNSGTSPDYLYHIIPVR